jgi:hypothetical protein
MQFTLIEEGAFREGFVFPESTQKRYTNNGTNYYYDDPRPLRVRYGFLKPGSGEWEGTTDLDIEYDTSGVNRAVQIDVPDSRVNQTCAYALLFSGSDSTSDGFWSEQRRVNLGRPRGEHVCLPIMNYSKLRDGYLLNSLYDVLVWEQPGPEPVRYQGRVKYVYYGFTDADRNRYEEDHNPPWKDSDGKGSLEGVVEVRHRVIGGQFGSSVMPLVRVRVPEGMNLVYRLGIDKFDRDAFWHDQYRGYAETQVYYRPFSYPG